MSDRSLAQCGLSARKSLVMASLSCETTTLRSYGSECKVLHPEVAMMLTTTAFYQKRWLPTSLNQYPICTKNSSHSECYSQALAE